MRLTSSTLLLLVALLLAGSDALAQYRGNVTSLNSPQHKALAATREWTLEEMKSAMPYPLAERKGAPAAYQVWEKATGAPGSTPAGRGGVTVKDSAAAEEADANVVNFETFAPPSYTYPFPYSRWEQLSTRYTDWPYRTVGKVFFKEGGQPFVCSASSIGNYGVITAGHCVSNGKGVFHTNWVFVPAYYQQASTTAAAAPYGQFTAANLWVTSPWHANSGRDEWENDIGGAVLNKNTVGNSTLKVSQRVGWLGTSWNQNIVQHWHSIGYPAASPFTGRRMIICTAGYAVTDISSSPLFTFGIGCDMTGGASGGPLIKNFAASAVTGSNQVNGVNSYKYTSTQPKALYSPYFGSNAQNIIGCIINSSPTVADCTAPAQP